MLHSILCFGIWTLIFSFIVNHATKGITQGIEHLKKMHQIPCANCIYFTGDYRLKCPVHPTKAMSEKAIACQDFQIKSDYLVNNVD
ncbi:MAG TPA: hypothetical protein ACFCUY_12965 [Xenococcaceae cyanobacterium]